MQHFVNLCEYLHTFGSGCNVSFARDSVYWSGRTRDGAAVVGQYKLPRYIPRGEVVLHVIRFSKGRGATVFSRRGITSRRGYRGARIIWNATSTSTKCLAGLFLEKMRRSLQRQLIKGAIIAFASRNDSVRAGPTADSLTWSCFNIRRSVQ
jgi:hypothetical protein